MRFGFDEVGRGCLAGPVTVCVAGVPDAWPRCTCANAPGDWNVLVPEWLKKARDSKKMSEKQRTELVKNIQSEPQIWMQLLSASARLIDEYGIGVILSHLLWLSVQIASSKKLIVSEFIADGQITIIEQPDEQLLSELYAENLLKNPEKVCRVLIGSIVRRENKADDTYLAVAIASTVAKVSRDNHLIKWAQNMPQYGFERHKGYGTQLHRDAIARYGVTSFHRASWIH
jgi:ribonuclease HII